MSQLGFGKFYGRIQNRYQCEGLLLSEVRHEQARKLPEHSHQSAFLSTLLGGAYRERGQGKEIEVSRFSTVYHHPGMSHQDEVGRTGGWFFIVEIDKNWFDECSPIKARDAGALVVEGPPLALQLFSSYKNGTLSPFEAETMVLELLGAAGPQEKWRDRAAPQWLRRAVETLHDDPAFPHTVRSLAKSVGVHPVHLARVFRSRYGYSINHYLQGLRLEIALRRLESEEAKIADVAFDAGFSDQSHLCRVLKHWTGETPAHLRKLLQG